MENEIWKDIEGYEGLYQVSNLGRVKSFDKIVNTTNQSRIIRKRTIKGKILKPIYKHGYCHISLYKNKKQKTYRIHRLVAEAFIPNPNNLPQINHKNKIRDDNKEKNLEWCDSQYNNDYSISKKIDQYDLNGNFIKTWDSIKKASVSISKKQDKIIDCCKKRRDNAFGYIWRYNSEREKK